MYSVNKSVTEHVFCFIVLQFIRSCSKSRLGFPSTLHFMASFSSLKEEEEEEEEEEKSLLDPVNE